MFSVYLLLSFFYLLFLLVLDLIFLLLFLFLCLMACWFHWPSQHFRSHRHAWLMRDYLDQLFLREQRLCEHIVVMQCWYDMIRYDMIWYYLTWNNTICSDTILLGMKWLWYDTIRFYTIRYDIIYDMLCYDMTWHDMTWCDAMIRCDEMRWYQHMLIQYDVTLLCCVVFHAFLTFTCLQAFWVWVDITGDCDADLRAVTPECKLVLRGTRQ